MGCGMGFGNDNLQGGRWGTKGRRPYGGQTFVGVPNVDRQRVDEAEAKKVMRRHGKLGLGSPGTLAAGQGKVPSFLSGKAM